MPVREAGPLIEIMIQFDLRRPTGIGRICRQCRPDVIRRAEAALMFFGCSAWRRDGRLTQKRCCAGQKAEVRAFAPAGPRVPKGVIEHAGAARRSVQGLNFLSM